MLFRILAAAALAATLCACGTPAKIVHADDPVVKPAVSSGTLNLRRIVTKQPAGEHVGQLMAGLTCTGKGDLTTKAVNAETNDREILKVVYDELKAANYELVGTPDDLFDDPSRSGADFQLAGVVSNQKGNLCYPLAGLGNVQNVKGEYSLNVEWQVYSRERKAVIYSVTTAGSSKLEESTADGFRILQFAALRQATKGLLADDGFRNAVARGASSQGSRPRS